MAADDGVAGVFDDPEKTAQKGEIEDLAYQLECIVNADTRLLFDEYGAYKSPVDWPDEIALAVKRVTPHSTGGFIVDFQDKRAALETLAKIKGYFASEEEDKNPLEQALSKVPREELIKIRDLLKGLEGGQDELSGA